jgi:hypothetical protein
MGRHIHVSNNLPPVTGESIVQEGGVYWSRSYTIDNDNTLADFSWYKASRVNVDGSVLTVTIARKMKDAPYVDKTPTERWTQWKKLELRSGGTVQSMMASLQADGGFELVVAEEKDLSVEKVKQFIQRNYIDKESIVFFTLIQVDSFLQLYCFQADFLRFITYFHKGIISYYTINNTTREI